MYDAWIDHDLSIICGESLSLSLELLHFSLISGCGATCSRAFEPLCLVAALLHFCVHLMCS